MGSTDGSVRGQYLSFTLGDELCAVAILHVREIVAYEPPTRVPSVPRSVRGVINLRGRVVPVVDLAARFGLTPAPITVRTCILVVEIALDGEPEVIGIVADTVREVLELGPHDVEAAPPLGTPVPAGDLLGLARLEGRFVNLLDLPRVLAADLREGTGASAAAVAAAEAK